MLESIALFLDVDGTLVPLAETPDAVRVGPRLIELLRALSLRTQGALALISGRSIQQLDALFAPLHLPAAGLHGFERRDSAGVYSRYPTPSAGLASAREAMRVLSQECGQLLLEDKEFGLALHYRRAPQLHAHLMHVMQEIAARAGPQFELQLGRYVVELRPAGVSKGEVVRNFLREAPFHGRYPIYIGDDLTDESAFGCVNAAGGLSIGVDLQAPTAARIVLPDTLAVSTWLSTLVQDPQHLLGRALADTTS